MWYSKLLHKGLKELRQNINQMLNPQNTRHRSPINCEYLWENWPRYNGTALYNEWYNKQGTKKLGYNLRPALHSNWLIYQMQLYENTTTYRHSAIDGVALCSGNIIVYNQYSDVLRFYRELYIISQTNNCTYKHITCWCHFTDGWHPIQHCYKDNTSITTHGYKQECIYNCEE